jgi:hypothetical protein
MIRGLGAQTPKKQSDNDAHAITTRTGGSMIKRLAGKATSRRTRLMGILATLAMTAGLLAGTAAPASAAEQRCNQFPPELTFNACLTIDYVGGGRWNVHVGFDRYLARWHADQVLACGGFFFSELWGDDGGHPYDDNLGGIPLIPGWPQSGTDPTGLFAEFFSASMNLNEDDGWWDNGDEVYAEVTFRDCVAGRWITVSTGTIVGTF